MTCDFIDQEPVRKRDYTTGFATFRDGAKDLLLVIGGDEGLDQRMRQSADLVLSLSKMTLPHRLARVVLVEQLYRAFTLLKGEPYHK